jgi:two-component sensor histidine kinase
MADAIRSGVSEVLLSGSDTAESEQLRATQSQELLIAELNHRVRNVLALIRGLISQTQHESGDTTSYVKSLSGRVQALARAHDKVTRHNWGPGPLFALFEDEIAAYVPASRDRFIIEGAAVLLHPQAFSTLALVIHELVTNSSKYGSLSDSGRVTVTLRATAGEGLHLLWRESGGPLVNPPTRRGFGSVIIERVVPFDLQGTTAIRYLPTGFEADFFIPEQHLVPAELTTAPFRDSPPPGVALMGMSLLSKAPLQGRKVLLLEDNLIVALEAEALLRSLGAVSVFAVSTVAAAVRMLSMETVDFGVLDINLGFETSLTFGLALRAAKIPYLFASGYGESPIIGAMHESVITVSKPYDRESLALAIGNTLDS